MKNENAKGANGTMDKKNTPPKAADESKTQAVWMSEKRTSKQVVRITIRNQVAGKPSPNDGRKIPWLW